MRLRKLELRDAPAMLKWMHDPGVVENMQTDFKSKSLKDCENFIINSALETGSVHLAIADDADQYMGTVSLKNITGTNAEFAITICREAMGKGYSSWAMKEIIRRGFEEYGLSEIYWCVSPDNHRAVRFYDKNNYPRVDSSSIRINGGYTPGQIDSYIWYQVANSITANLRTAIDKAAAEPAFDYITIKRDTTGTSPACCPFILSRLLTKAAAEGSSKADTGNSPTENTEASPKTVDEDPPESSIIVLTYEPRREKLFLTLESIVSQTYSDYELLITDDGSKKSRCYEVIDFLESKHFLNYTYLLHRTNVGTVRNTWDAVIESRGKYIKLISPGDALAAVNAMDRWIRCLKNSGKRWSFADAVYYGINEDGSTRLLECLCHPQMTNCYKKHDDLSCRINYVAYFDNLVGATILSERHLMLEYLKRILGEIIYIEDSIYYMMMFDGILPEYYPREAILYEVGCGVSTTADWGWIKKIREEWDIVKKLTFSDFDSMDRTQKQIYKIYERVELKKYRKGWLGKIQKLRRALDKGQLKYKISGKLKPRMSTATLPEGDFSCRLLNTHFSHTAMTEDS